MWLMRIRSINPLLLLLCAACAQSRIITITSQPPGAQLSVEGIARGPAPLTDKFVFHNSAQVYHITATHSGYQDQSVVLTRDDLRTEIEVELKPFTRRLTFTVSPVPATISIDGTLIGPDPVQKITRELEFTKDDQDRWTTHRVMASRVGFQPAELIVTYDEPGAPADYVLQLQPMRKTISIITTPPGAAVSIDGESLGVTPISREREFTFDIDSNQFAPQKLRITKPGFDVRDETIYWDSGRTDYSFNLAAKKKTVRIATDPAGASVSIDGNPVSSGADGVPTADLTFTPQNDKGDLPVFVAAISKKTAESEWYPTTMPIAWDGGKKDYPVKLTEIRSRMIPLTSVVLERNSDGVWEFGPQSADTLAMKDVGDGPGKEPPALVYVAPPGNSIGTLTVSPSGSKILFTLLSGKTKLDLRSQILSISSGGTGGVEQITDGKALDIMPAFTPDGQQIVFASNRTGRRLNIWRKPITGGAGIEQLTNTEEQDLWPMVDAGPRPRLFYEALSDSQADAQLYEAPVEGGPRLDLTTISVSQPRISPRADSIVFTSVNSRTGNREIYRIPDRGGPPANLTNDPDSDCYDPVWSKDGGQIAYVSNRAIAPISDRDVESDRRHNADIWVIDLSHPDKPAQVTTNASVDDCPAWDPSGNSVYFRSDRGGHWGIWKIAVK